METLSERLLSEPEVHALEKVFERFQVDWEQEPGCEYNWDPPWIMTLDGLRDGPLCHAPRLRWDQYARVLNLLDQYLEGN